MDDHVGAAVPDAGRGGEGVVESVGATEEVGVGAMTAGVEAHVTVEAIAAVVENAGNEVPDAQRVRVRAGLEREEEFAIGGLGDGFERGAIGDISAGDAQGEQGEVLGVAQVEVGRLRSCRAACQFRSPMGRG